MSWHWYHHVTRISYAKFERSAINISEDMDYVKYLVADRGPDVQVVKYFVKSGRQTFFGQVRIIMRI